MKEFHRIILGIALLVGISYTIQSNAGSHGKRTLLRDVFKKVDLSKNDKAIDSILDKQHTSKQELELLKAQAMLEALEENAYSISSAEELIPATQIAFAALAKHRQTFDERLEEMGLEDHLKDELSTFAASVKALASRVVTEFEEFQQSDKVKHFQQEAEKTATEVGKRVEETAEDFVHSEQFKKLQEAAADIFKKFNKALSKFGKDGKTPEKKLRNNR